MPKITNIGAFFIISNLGLKICLNP